MNTGAWACALAPHAVAALGPIVRLAEKAVEKWPNDANVLNTLGAMLYRARRWEEAVQRLKEAVAKSQGKKGSASDWLFLAMAHQELGHTEEAKSCLAKAGGSIKDDGIGWRGRPEYQILHRQAEGLVKGSKR
jgi:uncharacterized protein HemY